MTKIIFVNMVGDEIFTDEWENTSTEAIQEYCVEEEWELEEIFDHDDGVVEVMVYPYNS